MGALPELPADSIILDVGCGTGYHLPHLAEKYTDSTVIGMDLSTDMLEKANAKCKSYPNVKLINEAYNELAFEADSIDLVICSYSLSMIDDTSPILNGIQCHLKETGMVAVLDFKNTRHSWFEKWMNVNHVDFNSSLFPELQTRFQTVRSLEKNAYSSLWNFGLFIGRKQHS